jgi:hypothetical protein
MFYQDKQYLASFIRRAIPMIMRDHGIEEWREHESYLPNGGNIDEYLMQFTGLEDCDGVDVYEGDILDAGVNMPYQVMWDEERLAWMGKPQNGICFLCEMDMKHYQVIGNIYEHPQMIICV